MQGDTQGNHDSAHGGLVRREGQGDRGPEMTIPDYKMELNKVVQSSPDHIDLDGEWTTASGLKITVAGTEVKGPDGSGYKEYLAIQNGGRRVEMHIPDEKVTYWASLSGRGSLNWNDGDVWWRKIDCMWQPWSLFGACGGPCPEGMQQRRRGFELLQENGGVPCRGPKEECREATFCAQPGAPQKEDEAAHRLNTSDLGFDSQRSQEVLDTEARMVHGSQEIAKTAPQALLFGHGFPARSGSERPAVASALVAAAAASLVVLRAA